MGTMSQEQCYLCREGARVLGEDTTGLYYHCSHCQLIFVHGLYQPEQEEEKHIYCQHENTRENEGYVRFLQQFLSQGVYPFLTEKPEKALDFGCGPGPVLQELLQEEGVSCYSYDPIFASWDVHGQVFDLITCTEVVEHFSRPRETWQELIQLLSPGGLLVVMTLFHPGPAHFFQWWYRRDPTHVAFYNQKTFSYLEQETPLSLLHEDGERIAVFIKE